MIVKFIDLIQSNRSESKIEFLQIEVFDILANQLNFRVINFNGKELFLERINDQYQIVPFQKLRDKFLDYLRNDINIEKLPSEISYENMMNKYYKKNPITKSYARNYFKSKLPLHEKDFVLNNSILLPKS